MYTVSNLSSVLKEAEKETMAFVAENNWKTHQKHDIKKSFGKRSALKLLNI